MKLDILTTMFIVLWVSFSAMWLSAARKETGRLGKPEILQWLLGSLSIIFFKTINDVAITYGRVPDGSEFVLSVTLLALIGIVVPKVFENIARLKFNQPENKPQDGKPNTPDGSLQ